MADSAILSFVDVKIFPIQRRFPFHSVSNFVFAGAFTSFTVESGVLFEFSFSYPRKKLKLTVLGALISNSKLRLRRPCYSRSILEHPSRTTSSGRCITNRNRYITCGTRPNWTWVTDPGRPSVNFGTGFSRKSVSLNFRPRSENNGRTFR